MSWDNDKPADDRVWNLAAGDIRDNNDALEAALGLDLNSGNLNVTSPTYGATGDGTTDDTTALQSALDAATSEQWVVFPSGTFMVSGLTVGSAQMIKGTNNTTIKLIAASNDHVFNTSADTTSLLVIQDITIDGNRDNQTTAGNGINLEGGANVLWAKLERVRITECYNYGLNIKNANIVSIEDGRIGECRYGALATDSEEVNFIGTNIEINDSYGLKYDAGNNAPCRVSGVWFENGGATPTNFIIIGQDSVKVDSCKFNGTGISDVECEVLTGFQFNMFLNNSFQNATTNPIDFNSGSNQNISIGNTGGAPTSTIDNDGRNYIFESSSVTEAFTKIGRTVEPFQTFGAVDATPSVSKGNLFLTGGTTTITDLDDGEPGQIVTIISVHAHDFDVTGTNLNAGTADMHMNVNDATTWATNADDGAWILIGYEENVTYPKMVEEKTIFKVSTTTAIDLAAIAGVEKILYTVPTGMTFMPTMVVLRDFSADEHGTPPIITLGTGGTSAEDFLGDQTLSNITANFARENIILQPLPNATPVTTDSIVAAGTFVLEITQANGAALTCTADTFGYLY